jgi:hypothetical protein
MPKHSLVECSFLIPIRRDMGLSDGKLHSARCWKWLKEESFSAFEGHTVAPGEYAGAYRDPDTKKQVQDTSRKYILAVTESRVPLLRALLTQACVVFKQKCIYLSVSGRVEFIGYPYDREKQKPS